MPSEREIREILSLLRSAGIIVQIRHQKDLPSPDTSDAALSGLRLCRIERAAVQVLMECRPDRLTLFQLRERIENRIGEPVGEGILKFYLSRLTSPEVAILDNTRPYGYQITQDFIEELLYRQSMGIGGGNGSLTDAAR